MEDYVIPELEKNGFNCPNCGAFTQQKWYGTGKTSSVSIKKAPGESKALREDNKLVKYSGYIGYSGCIGEIDYLNVAYCTKCGRYSFWFKKKMIYPKLSIAPLPLKEMPKKVKEDFNEARMIVAESPRGAAALLRLALEKLLPQVGAEGKKIDQMIGYLVREKNLPVQIQRALDSLRVIGNEAVHPGELDLKDDTKTALTLFKVLNVIVQTIIIQPKEIDDLYYDKVPERKKEGIKNRDRK